MKCWIVSLLVILALYLWSQRLVEPMQSGGGYGSACDWINRSGMIQLKQCCGCDADCLPRYICVNGTCQRPRNKTSEECRALGWTTCQNGVCID